MTSRSKQKRNGIDIGSVNKYLDLAKVGDELAKDFLLNREEAHNGLFREALNQSLRFRI